MRDPTAAATQRVAYSGFRRVRSSLCALRVIHLPELLELCKEPGEFALGIHDGLIGFVDSLVLELRQLPGVLLQLDERRPPVIEEAFVMFVWHSGCGFSSYIR